MSNFSSVERVGRGPMCTLIASDRIAIQPGVCCLLLTRALIFPRDFLRAYVCVFCVFMAQVAAVAVVVAAMDQAGGARPHLRRR